MSSRLLSRYFDPHDATPRDGSVWLALAAVALSLLLGVWAVCSSQVRKAETRQAALPDASLEQCDPSFALPAMGHCPSSRTLIGTR